MFESTRAQPTSYSRNLILATLVLSMAAAGLCGAWYAFGAGMLTPWGFKLTLKLVALGTLLAIAGVASLRD